MNDLHPILQWLFVMAAAIVPFMFLAVGAVWDRLYKLENRETAEVADLRARIERVVEHREFWQFSKRETPVGWTPDTTSAYRMAMDYVVDELLEVDR